jgi:phosphate transport system protein
MSREKLNSQIHLLQDEILLLGSMVESAVSRSVEALRTRDIPTAEAIYEDDQLINDKRFAIENAILILIATQQPITHDLRMLTSMLEVITELERMGDYAKGISKVVWRLGNEEVPVPNREFTQMAESSIHMLHSTLTAFVQEDAIMASEIAGKDDEIDALYQKVYQSLICNMISNPSIIDQSNLLLWVAHNLERLADRVVNICERIVFITTGDMLEFESSDDEDKIIEKI